MPGVWEGIDVLDLSWGIAGPIVSMLLADNGANVTKVEPPGGDPFRALSGYRVWQRGKRSAVLDLKDSSARDAFLRLADRADVVIESFSPGTTRRLGIDEATLRARNPRLVYCSITGYGPTGPDAQRPAYDALVAARSGLQWESRGVLGGTSARLSGTAPILPDFEVPVERWEGPPREGPMFTGVPWPSMGAAYLAHLGVSAALCAREVTGRGQLVETSLLAGALASGFGSWARAEHADAPGYESWIHDPRAFKGYFRCADGRWVHQWVPVPGLLAAAKGDRLEVTDEVRAHLSDDRVGTHAAELVHLQAVMDAFTSTFARFSSAEWERAAAEAGPSVAVVRSPEEALADPLLLADGCVTEVEDPELGRIRHVGRVYRLGRCDWGIRGPAPSAGAHTDEVVAQAQAAGPPPAPRSHDGGRALHHPLEGVRVVDFSIAVAGPFGAQQLAELGADVVKVNALDGIVLNAQMHGVCERSKRSIALDLKDPEGKKIFHRLVERADVVATNQREAAVLRLGLDYESIRAINPAIVYCHTRGYEDGPRKNLAGHDQSSAALAGVTWIEGGMDGGGRPHWPSISIGDTGNGFVWAAAVVQALYHRQRTGEGQKVDTAIVNAHLLNASSAWVSVAGGAEGERPRLDAMTLGFHALYRLYEGSDGWLCVAAPDQGSFERLCDAVGAPGLAADPRFATAAGRREHDAELSAALQAAMAPRRVAELRDRLDRAAVPCEISSPDAILEFFDDPTNVDRQRLTTFQDAVGGKTTSIGLLIDFSETPGKIWGPPIVVGDHTRDILTEIGYSDEEIAGFYAGGTVRDARTPARGHA